MSTYAKDLKKGVISAKDALRTVDYCCLECHSIVRLRMGQERRAHFYHLEPSPTCRESGKSLEHLMTQVHIQKQVNKPTLFLEKRFPSINRIADVALTDHKIIFEIQCSPMTAQEALGRMLDYNSIGYEVIWILHTKTFLKPKASAFEQCLFQKPHYFTDINEEGEGSIFDLWAPIDKGWRYIDCQTFPITVSQHMTNTRRNPFRNQWPLFFSGDILSHIHKKTLDLELYKRLFQKDDETENIPFFQRFWLHARLFFHEILKKHSQG